MVAFKKYFIKNRKRNISILLALLICITSVTVWITANKTNASVIVKDKDGNKIVQDEIRILEIVARNGQQVLGYTVEGQEPISVSDIENYEGDMDLDVDDFEAATGYKVTKSQNAAGKFNYDVVSNSLNNTLNENVFAQQMNKGEIVVKAVQASDLRVSDIETFRPNLVYINSNDYNDNLLYYYDQFKNHGAMGIQPGQSGDSYNGVYTYSAKKYDTAVNKIVEALGYADKAADLTPTDFEFIKSYHIGHAEGDVINLDNYEPYNFSIYIDKISETAEGSISGTLSEIVTSLNQVLGEVNAKAKEDAIQYIVNNSNKTEYTDSERASMLSALQSTGVDGYNALNADEYMKEIISYAYYGVTITEGDIVGYDTTPSLIATVNASSAATSINELVALKTKVNEYREAHPTEPGDPTNPSDPTEPTDPATPGEAVDENGLTMEDNINLYAYFQKADVGTINSDFFNEYTAEFFKSDFEFNGDVESVEALRNIITNINNAHRLDALTRLSDLPAASDETLIDSFAANAKSDFKLMDLKGYNEFYLDYYIDEIRKLTDANAFKTDDSYDESKIEAFLAGVNSSVDIYDTSFVVSDIPWKAAEALYNAVSTEETALIYNVDMLTNGTIGNYEADLSALADTQTSDYIRENGVREVDNTNNVYKMLLLLRQVRDTYYINELSAKIDDMGNYYPNGIGNDDAPVASWNKETFGTDYDNYAKYREPDVIGTTYDTDGTVGTSDGSYIYKKIYSYSGSQFFGGNLFTNGMDGSSPDMHLVLGNYRYNDTYSGGGIVTDKSLLEGSNYMLLHTYFASDSSIKNGNPLYTHLWDNSNQSAPETFYQVTREIDGDYYYRMPLIDGYNNFLITASPWWNSGHQTSDCWTNKSVSELVGKLYVLYGYDFYTGSWGSALGGITNSINNGTVEYEGSVEGLKFWMYANDTSAVSANYRIQVDGQYLYSGNDGFYHYDVAHTGNGSSQPFSYNDEIKIYKDKIIVGDDTIDRFYNGNPINIGKNSVVKITFTYSLSGYGTVTRTYSYKNVGGEDYNISISNFAKDGNVEFCGYANMLFTYENMEYVNYTIDGNTVAVNSGDSIEVGKTMNIGESKQLTITYKPNDKNAITIKTTLRKVNAEMPKNYLSTFTASNGAGLVNNPLLSAADNATLIGADKGGIIRYLLNVSLSDVNYPIRILEIQPTASVSELSGYDGAKKIADLYNIDMNADGITNSNFLNYIQVDYMSVKEFNTRNIDLAADYDLVYFGIKSGYQVVNTYTVSGQKLFRTYYNDSSMNGLVYTGIGDIYNIYPFLRGVAASDYSLKSNQNVTTADQKNKYEEWKKYFSSGLEGNDKAGWNLNDISATGGSTKRYYMINNTNSTTRITGNDISVMRMEDLLNYVKAGYPVLLADEIMDCVIYQDGKIIDNPAYVPYTGYENTTNAARWRYVDINSKMYNFVKQAKELGLDSNGYYTVKGDFKDGKTYAGLVSLRNAKNGANPEYLSSVEKFDGGLSFANRRISKIEFEYVKGPQEYNKDAGGNEIASGNLGVTISNSSQEHKTFDITLNIKRNGGVDERELQDRYKYVMYVDKSGIGKFEDIDTVDVDCEHEFIKNEEGKVTQVRVTGNWPGEIEGFIPWKLELTEVNNPDWKFTYKAFSAFERASSEKKDVYVLWIYPSEKLTLSFKTVLNDNRTSLNQTEFNIHMLALTYREFDSTWSGMSGDTVFNDENSKLKVATMYNRMSTNSKNNCWNLKGNEASLTDTDIDMIVVGFSDSFAEMDIVEMAALNNIKYFLDAGHSLLYSHDNSSYLPTLNWYVDEKGNHGSGSNSVCGRYTTVFFRRMLGMDTYGVSYGSDDSLPIEYENARKYLADEDVNQENFRGITENCIFHYSPTATVNGVYRLGRDRLYSDSMNSSSPNNYGDWCHTNSVMKTNRGQITEYPYILGEIIPTTITHSQYFTVSLEDPDLTVWYTLDVADNSRPRGNNSQMYQFTKGDGANNYYIYSKGNITYTGSGHASGQTADEKKLFINTVIAAIKIPNFKPVVTLKSGYKKDGETYVDYVTGSTGVNITFNPADNDMRVGENAFTDCKIFVDIDGDGEYTPGVDILMNDPSDVQVSNPEGTPENVVGTELRNREDKTFRLTTDNITAIDDKIKTSDPSKSIYDYKIVLTVSDKGYLKALDPIPAIGSVSFRLQEKTTPTYDLFSLK